MVKHIAKIVLGEELYNIKDTEVRGDLNNHASNTDIHVTAAEKEYWNSKVNPPSYSAPTAKQLTYTGEAQELLNPGSSTSGSIQYSTDEVNWSTTIPQATNAGTYTVYWKFAGSEIVYVDSTAINVSIAKVTPIVTAPTAKTGLVYTGSAQELINAGSTDFGTLQYSLDNETYGTSVPSVIAGGDYTVYYKVVEDSNVNGTNAQSIGVSVAKLNRNVSFVNANGHEFIDLGLPGGILWATMNVGANAETDYGNLYKYGLGASSYNYNLSDYTGKEDPLSLNVDTARQVWGGSWHMPTMDLFYDLINYTTYTWTTVNGVNGGKFTAQNGNYIFIPAAGFWDFDGTYGGAGYNGNVWSSSPSGSSGAYHLNFYDGNPYVDSYTRKQGYSVRGIIESSIKTALDIGQTNTIEVFTEGSPTITVTSSNTSVATVSGMTVTAVSGGSTTITITIAADNAYNEYTYNYTLSVYDPYRLGQEWFDLGLPSGRLWARGNIVPKEGGGYKIGSELEYGAYFSWGNIVPHFSSNGSSFDDGYSFDSTAYNSTPGASLTGDIASNDAAHDAALACLGSSARMPTKEELQELYDNTDRQRLLISGVLGMKFMKKSDHSVYIFLPYAGYGYNTHPLNRGYNGYYWSSSYKNSNSAYNYYDSYISSLSSFSRIYGLLVRAVK